jgi:cell division septation protein DedD
VDRLIAEGQFSDGRTVLEGWLGRGWDGASRAEREHGLWLRALLTIDPAIAELDYRRLVVEYPGGRFSDQALLRLAQGARALGDREAALRYLEILIRDYPESPYRVEARTLMASVAQDPLLARTVPPPTVSAPTTAVPTAAVPTAPPSSTPATSTPSLPTTVQLGAFSSEAAARALLSDPRLEGFGVRLVRVPGSALFRVRIGAFATPEEATGLLQAIQGRGIPAILSSDRDLESLVR